MQFEQLFSSAIEVAIATAGFSGIVVILGQRSEGKWSEADLARVSLLLQSSFVAISLSFLPQVLYGAELPDSTIWRISSTCFVVYAAVAVPLRHRSIQRIQSSDPTYSRTLFVSVLPLVLFLMGLQVYNVLVSASGWPFVLTILFELAVAFLAFVRLLRTLWAKSAA